jgi:hypothetical protein
LETFVTLFPMIGKACRIHVQLSHRREAALECGGSTPLFFDDAAPDT